MGHVLPEVVHLVGPPGAGKAALAAEITRRLGDGYVHIDANAFADAFKEAESRARLASSYGEMPRFYESHSLPALSQSEGAGSRRPVSLSPRRAGLAPGWRQRARDELEEVIADARGDAGVRLVIVTGRALGAILFATRRIYLRPEPSEIPAAYRRSVAKALERISEMIPALLAITRTAPIDGIEEEIESVLGDWSFARAGFAAYRRSCRDLARACACGRAEQLSEREVWRWAARAGRAPGRRPPRPGERPAGGRAGAAAKSAQGDQAGRRGAIAAQVIYRH